MDKFWNMSKKHINIAFKWKKITVYNMRHWYDWTLGMFKTTSSKLPSNLNPSLPNIFIDESYILSDFKLTKVANVKLYWTFLLTLFFLIFFLNP